MAQQYYVRSEDGFYYYDLGIQYGVVRSRITPADNSTMERWAASLIEAAQDVIDHGFGLCCDGTEYDLNNFLADTHGGDVPWDTQRMKQLYTELMKHPKFVSTMKAFEAKYGDIHFPLTWKDYLAESGCTEEEF